MSVFMASLSLYIYLELIRTSPRHQLRNVGVWRHSLQSKVSSLPNMKRLRAEEEGEMETIKTANLLLSLACGGGEPKRIQRKTKPDDGMFECKTCSRRFPSFQALGGHRTSHNKRQRLQLILGLDYPMQGPRSKPTVHECSICRQTFSTGQALGGHMRRHKPLGEAFPEKKAGGVDKKAMLDFNLLLPLGDDGSRERSRGVLLELFV